MQNFKFIFPILVAALMSACGDDNNNSNAGGVGVPSPVPTSSASPTSTPTSSPTPGMMTVTIAAGASGRTTDAFGANPLIVSMGTTVTWTNQDTVAHTVTATDGSFDSGNIAPGGNFSHTFDNAGTFSYTCTIHPNMMGSVQVQ